MNFKPIILLKNTIAQYESLRELVVKQTTHFSSNYLSVIRQGLLAWMTSDSKEINMTDYSIEPSSNEISPLDESIIQVLTNMVIHIQQEAHYAI